MHRVAAHAPLLRRRARSPLAAVLALAAGAAALAGCTHVQGEAVDRHVIVGAMPEDYRTTHPIAIEEGIETLDVPVGLNSVRLTAGVRGNIAGFARAFRASGSAAMAIVLPAGSANQASARGIAGEVRAELLSQGVAPGAIEWRSYHAAATEATAPIRLAYSRIGARTAGCGPWPDQFAHTAENRNYFNYGCASQQNLAAMVDNPLDLLYPRAMPPPDAARRVAVIGDYQGEAAGSPSPTQSDYSKEPGAAVAQGVGSSQ
jgi:pilus assembly protein CpaD